MRLFHFSDDGDIDLFEPRPVLVPSSRAPGREWLNGPLVWAIDEPHQAMYLFPRACPRILLWQTPATTDEDRAAWWGRSTNRMIAFVEEEWLQSIRLARLYRYELPPETFLDLEDAGMWVSHDAVAPLRLDPVDDLIAALQACDVELRPVPVLTPLRDIWSSSLHASGIRLRNAKQWT